MYCDIHKQSYAGWRPCLPACLERIRESSPFRFPCQLVPTLHPFLLPLTGHDSLCRYSAHVNSRIKSQFINFPHLQRMERSRRLGIVHPANEFQPVFRESKFSWTVRRRDQFLTVQSGLDQGPAIAGNRPFILQKITVHIFHRSGLLLWNSQLLTWDSSTPWFRQRTLSWDRRIRHVPHSLFLSDRFWYYPPINSYFSLLLPSFRLPVHSV
jgi:hypothetical protein